MQHVLKRALSRGILAVGALLVATSTSCVAYDAAGPAVPNITGTYATIVAIDYGNHLESRSDTLVGTLHLHDQHYRGHFGGAYLLAGDSGVFDGALRPEGTLTVTDWGAAGASKPIAYVGALRQLYPWCDFTLLGAGPLSGSLLADTLVADASGALPCYYQLFGQAYPIGTGFHVHIVGVR